MSRDRGDRRGSRNGNVKRVASAALVDPAVLYSAILAYRAEDAVVNAGVIDQLNPFMGATVLLPGGTKKSATSADGAMNGALTIPSSSGVGYAASVTVPTTLTVVAAWRYNTGGSASNALFCHTVGGTVNTGQAMFTQAAPQMITRASAGVAQDSNIVGTPAAGACITVGVWAPGSPVSARFNSVTPTLSAGNMTANAGNQLRLMDINSAGAFPLIGALGTIAFFDRVLTNTEVGYAMAYYGAKYGVTVAGAPPL